MEGARRYPPNQDSDARGDVNPAEATAASRETQSAGGGDGGVSRDAERGRTHGKALRGGVFREFAKSRLEVDLAEGPRRGRRDVESGERTRRRQPASTRVVVGDFGQHAVVEFASRALIRSR